MSCVTFSMNSDESRVTLNSALKYTRGGKDIIS